MIQIKIFPLGPLQTNSHLLYNNKEAIAIDVGGDPSPMLRFLEKNSLTLSHIFCSHLHFDHTYGVAALSKATGAPILAHEGDAFMLNSELGLGGSWGLPSLSSYSFTPLEPGSYTYLDSPCTVLSTPGHSPGGLSFYFPEASLVAVGDTLFQRSVGRTDFPGGDLELLMHSIHTQLFVLPPETLVYPGHGDSTRIGEEKMGNPFTGEFTF